MYPEFDRASCRPATRQVSRRCRSCAPVDWDERQRSTRKEVARELQPSSALPGSSAFPIHAASLGQGFRDQPVNFVIVTGDSYENLAAAVADSGRDEPNPGLAPDTDLRLNKPEIFLRWTARAPTWGSASTSGRTVETMLGGRVVTRYKRGAEPVRRDGADGRRGRTRPRTSSAVRRGRNDAMVPLSPLVKVREAVSPRELNHFNQRRSVTITANLGRGLRRWARRWRSWTTPRPHCRRATPPSSTA